MKTVRLGLGVSAYTAEDFVRAIIVIRKMRDEIDNIMEDNRPSGIDEVFRDTYMHVDIQRLSKQSTSLSFSIMAIDYLIDKEFPEFDLEDYLQKLSDGKK